MRCVRYFLYIKYALPTSIMNYTLSSKQQNVIKGAASPAPIRTAKPATLTPKTPPPAPTQAAPTKTKQRESKKYTEEDIQELLSDGYIGIHPNLWDYIPAGAHIRFVKKDVDKKGLTRAERFKPGGFVRNHFTTEEGKKMMMIETKPGGRPGADGYISFPIAYEGIEELWKKYDRSAFIEIHLIYTSLAQKKRQIEELEARIKKLESQRRQ